MCITTIKFRYCFELSIKIHIVGVAPNVHTIYHLCGTYYTTRVGQKLKEALDMQLFQRAADDQFAWIREAQKHLDSDNIGKDLLSVRFLLKKHEVYMHIH